MAFQFVRCRFRAAKRVAQFMTSKPAREISQPPTHSNLALVRTCCAVSFCALALWLSLYPENASAQEKREDAQVRFLAFVDARETLVMYADSDFPGSKIASTKEWDQWIREQDREIRSRIDRGVEDSISNLILFGTSFTKLPRFINSGEAMDAAEKLKPAALARVRQLAAAVGTAHRNERVEFVSTFLKRKQVTTGQREDFLTRNLARYVMEQREYQRKLEYAAESGDKSEILAARGTLYAQRGLSVDTSLLPNFAIEDTLRILQAKGVLQAGSIKRIAIVGPGLDFTDKRDGYDFYPLQTIQPFAVMEAVERLGLGKRDDLRVVTLDLNAAVNAHVANLAEAAKKGRAYQVQLPRDAAAQWTSQAVNYWEKFGEVIGKPASPLAVPDQLPSVKLKAVAISADRGARITALDLNVVAQTVDFADGEGFDLVVATNILVYYDHFQQALAMGNIARMMNAKGIFVSNTALPAAHDERLKYLGGRNVAYAQDGSYGDDVVVYQRR
jgi:hypothetical protein